MATFGGPFPPDPRPVGDPADRFALRLGVGLGVVAALLAIVVVVFVAVQPEGRESVISPTIPAPATDDWRLHGELTIVPVPDDQGETSAGDLVVLESRVHGRDEQGLAQGALRVARWSLGQHGWRLRWGVELPPAPTSLAVSSQAVAVSIDGQLRLLATEDGDELGRWSMTHSSSSVAVVGEVAVVANGDRLLGFRPGVVGPAWVSDPTIRLARARAFGDRVLAAVLPTAADAAAPIGAVVDPATGSVRTLADPCPAMEGRGRFRSLLAAVPVAGGSGVVGVFASQAGTGSTCIARLDLTTGEAAWAYPAPGRDTPADVHLISRPGHLTVAGVRSGGSGWALDVDPASGRSVALELPPGVVLDDLVANGETVVGTASVGLDRGQPSWEVVGWDRASGELRWHAALAGEAMPSITSSRRLAPAPSATSVAAVDLPEGPWVVELDPTGAIDTRALDPGTGRSDGPTGRAVVPLDAPGAAPMAPPGNVLVGSWGSVAVLAVGGQLVAVEPAEGEPLVFVAD